MPGSSGSGYGSGYGDGYGYGYGYGDGDGSGYSYGSGYGSGYGYGYGDGYGSGYSSGYGYGYGYGADVGQCGAYPARLQVTWGVLSIGCEIHTLDEWIEQADEIDSRHGDGIADETRAFALRLKNELQSDNN